MNKITLLLKMLITCMIAQEVSASGTWLTVGSKRYRVDVTIHNTITRKEG